MQCNRQVFVILDHFLPFYANNTLENKNFEKIRKSPWDIIISHICIINENHMMYGSWDMEHNSFFYHFRPLYPTNNQKNHNFKKMKETPREHHFKVMYHKWRSWPTIPEIWSVTNRIFVILDHFLPIYIKILKWKNCLKISPFYTCVPEMVITCMVPEISSATGRIVCYFGSFFALLLH